MTIERAIEILNPEHREHYDSIEIVEEACRMGMGALEKQMPRKPNRGVCPSCGSRHIYAATLMKAECFKYCGDCGQALDWSDSDD